jgi:hypothetical protein
MQGEKVSHRKAIGQGLLADLLERQRAAREAKRRLAETRRHILDLVGSGAAVEPGPLVLRVTSREQASFRREHLESILGKDEVGRLRGLLPVIVVQYVQVQEA